MPASASRPSVTVARLWRAAGSSPSRRAAASIRSSVGPSVASVYGRRLRLDGAACLGISQSGASPDIVAMMASARDGGALTVAITNVVGSMITREAAGTIYTHAGP